MSLYLWLKFIHVMFAIIAVGSNVTFFVWLNRLGVGGDVTRHVLRTVKFIDGRVANPSYGMLLVTGIALGYTGDLWEFVWLHAGMGIFTLVFLLAVFGFTPSLKRMITSFDEHGLGSEPYTHAAKRTRSFGSVIFVLVVAIVGFMTIKPVF